MNIYATIMTTKDITFQVMVSSRNGENGELIQRYRSKKGFESLIYNPSIGIAISGRANNNGPRIVFPHTMLYAIANTLSKVYEDLSSEKLYIKDDKQLLLDAKYADKYAKKVVSYNSALIFRPAIYDNRDGGSYGISVNIDGQNTGIMSHNEVRNVLDTFERFDITTFTMLAAMVDKLGTMDQKLDAIYSMLNDMYMRQPQVTHPAQTSTGLDFKPVSESIYH